MAKDSGKVDLTCQVESFPELPVLPEAGETSGFIEPGIRQVLTTTSSISAAVRGRRRSNSIRGENPLCTPLTEAEAQIGSLARELGDQHLQGATGDAVEIYAKWSR